MYLEKLFPSLFKNKNPKSFQCEICQFSKHTCSTFPSRPYKPSHPFTVFHRDVRGPSRVKHILGFCWFVSFIDDHTRLTWVYLLKEKSEVGQVFPNFHKMIQNQFQTKIKILRTDNAKEFFKYVLGVYLLDQGIIHQSSCVDTPQQNGIAERKNKHLLEVARSLSFSTNVPKQFWGDAILTATYLINRMPSQVLNFQTPFQVLLKHYPSSRLVSTIPLKIFGCSAFVHVHSHNHGKLDPRAIKCIFLRYSPNQKGYKCYSPITRRYYHSMDVTFFENQPFYPNTVIQGEREHNEEYQYRDIIESPPNVVPIPSVLQSVNPNVPNVESAPNVESLPSESSHPILDLPTNNELRVYSRRARASRQEEESQTLPKPDQEPNLDSLNKGNIISEDPIEIPEDDLDCPIALRKGVRSCTQHPLHNYISYSGLSPKFRDFVTNLDAVQVPTNF